MDLAGSPGATPTPSPDRLTGQRVASGVGALSLLSVETGKPRGVGNHARRPVGLCGTFQKVLLPSAKGLSRGQAGSQA